MASEVLGRIQNPSILEHNLNQFFDELSAINSSDELARSEVYQKVKSDAERILNSIVGEDFAPAFSGEKTDFVKCIAWNIERGRRFAGILDALESHQDLRDKDLLLLTELDYGMARSHNLFVARELAEKLKLNYLFAPVYIALQKGSGVEAFVEGENKQSLHGLGIFSKFPIENAYAVPLPNGQDKMRGKEKRLGQLRAVVADIAHPAGKFRAVCVHLDVHCSRAHRVKQMKIVLDFLKTLSPLPTIIGGDWNTTTFNAQSATRAILGFWRRVFMGTRNVVKNHYPHPDRFFERDMFAELERNGFSYKEFNEEGIGTLHYDMDNIAYNTNLGDWVPAWCFHFIFWASKKVGGKFSLRLDWFAGKQIELRGKPDTIANLKDAENHQLSDHDPITLDFTLSKS